MIRSIKRCFVLLMVVVLPTHSFAEDSLFDTTRNRNIPISISMPFNESVCSAQLKCPVVFWSAGYGVSHTRYAFVKKYFTELGYLFVAVGHELPADPPLSVSGNLYETRAENWQRGSETLRVVRKALSEKYSEYDFNKVVLAGHSNGGDISAWLANEGHSYVDKVITLDHRRVPLPRSSRIGVLSIRASDFEADEGILPTIEEREAYGSCIIEVAHSRHNDMTDSGPDALKQRIWSILRIWLLENVCIENMDSIE